LPRIDRGLGKLLAVLDRIIDPRVGVMSAVWELPPDPGTPRFFHFRGFACNTGAFAPDSNFRETGGASTDRWLAMAKAVGEGVERYCSALYDREECKLSTYDDADFPCVPPGDFALYAKSQYETRGFPFVPFETDTWLRWAPCLDPLTGEVVAVPAVMIWVPYVPGPEEQRITQSISTGLCCHESYARAALGGVCEVLERDAFTITWQRRLAAPQMIAETLSEENYRRVALIEAAGGGRVDILNITPDHGVPTVMAVLRSSNSESPALVLATATHPSPEEAVRESLEELAHTRRYSELIKVHVPGTPDEYGLEAVKTQVDHLAFWADQRRLDDVEWMFRSKKRIEFGELEDLSTGDASNDLRLLSRRIADTGHRVLLRDLTSPDIADLGLAVVRAVIPGYHPLQMGHFSRSLGGERLWALPRRLGYDVGDDPAEGDNHLPHPFP
jgi:ribosomal protein S12 methylthiotransferase accessory factor